MRFSKMSMLGCLFLAGCGSGSAVSRHDMSTANAANASTTAEARTTERTAAAHPTMQGPVASLGIPTSEFPPLGSCRVWMAGAPAGQQQPPCSCFSLMLDVPAGAMVLYRPTNDASVVQVTKYDPVEPNTIVAMEFYDAKSGKYLRSAN